MMPTSPIPQDDLYLLVSRFGYGIRAEEYKDLLRLGASGWLDEQLTPPKEDDKNTKERLQNLTLHIKYDAAPNKWSAVDEMRPLSSLTKPIDELWALFDSQKQINPQERARPRTEVIAATLLRSVYSRYQTREVMSQFWHDHFHVNAFSDDHIAVALPTYDHDVIRQNCLGNFRELLEAVASSTTMQYYLSNHSSRAGAANENYARELFELHTLGREAYLNDHYDRWREVPGAPDGHPQGYIDEDVYEAARAFTGWTIEDGAAVDGGRRLAATGKFIYVENWHDGYQKRVLAHEFEPFDKPMGDGRKVLDLVADHPATARHLAGKLCQRFLGPNVPASLLERATQKWLNTTKSPDQLAQVVRLIALSDEFNKSRFYKVKRPLALMAGYVRLLGFDFIPSEGLFNQMSNAGQRLFGAPTPVGLPDDNKIFLSTNSLRNRWQLLLGLAQNAWGNGVPKPSETLYAWGDATGLRYETPADLFTLFGVPTNTTTLNLASQAAGLVPFAPILHNEDGERRKSLFSAVAAMAPEYQVC